MGVAVAGGVETAAGVGVPVAAGTGLGVGVSVGRALGVAEADSPSVAVGLGAPWESEKGGSSESRSARPNRIAPVTVMNTARRISFTDGFGRILWGNHTQGHTEVRGIQKSERT